MFKTPKLKEHSFLVYGLGKTGSSVINFFKEKKISNFKVYDDKSKNLFQSYKTKNLNKTLKQVDYIILSPGISLNKNKNLRKYKKKIITDLDLFYLDRKKFKSIVVRAWHVCSKPPPHDPEEENAQPNLPSSLAQTSKLRSSHHFFIFQEIPPRFVGDPSAMPSAQNKSSDVASSTLLHLTFALGSWLAPAATRAAIFAVWP